MKVTNMSNYLSLANDKPALARLAAVAKQAQTIALLKFAKGKWFIGDDEVAAGREFIAHPDQLAQGYTKFVGGKVVEQKIGIVADPTFVLPSRDELGDTDENRWEIDNNGKPRDPWVLQYFLPLEDGDTGELMSFTTSSQGGNSAIGKLTGLYLNNMHRGRPMVQLATGFYKHKTFGRVEVPEFKVSGWAGAVPVVSHEPPPYDGPTYDMSDEQSPF
jgi:hypothetical protein